MRARGDQAFLFPLFESIIIKNVIQTFLYKRVYYAGGYYEVILSRLWGDQGFLQDGKVTDNLLGAIVQTVSRN